MMPQDGNFAQAVAEDAPARPGGAAMGRGAAPVMVTLPLQGKETYFEKLLALEETLEVSFEFKGLRRR